jgi:dihydrofolate synthase/folylpolyglutamate synthase
MKSYSEILDFLYHFTPAYHKIGSIAYKPGLEKSYHLDEYFGHPHRYYQTIHIGGTNGKGSVSHALAAILAQAGYKVGLYTSPHLVDFVERIKINGKEAPHEYVINFVEQHQDIILQVQPSFFEFTTFMAFEYFKIHQVDVAIVEVGMGGRLDTTNLIQPILTLITNVSYDHQQFLGDTLEKIAFEKAGIIKKNVPVIIGEHHPETDKIFIQKSQNENSILAFAEDAFEWELLHADYQQQTLKDKFSGTVFTTDLIGSYQQKNLKSILLAVQYISDFFPNIKKNYLDALKNIKKTTGLRGRMEILEYENIKILLDVAHNEAGITELIQNLNAFGHKNLHFILGFVNDKKINKILSLFPKEAQYYFVKPSVERGLDAKTLQNEAKSIGLSGKSYDNIFHSWQDAKNQISSDELLVVAGSCFLIGDLLKNLKI